MAVVGLAGFELDQLEGRDVKRRDQSSYEDSAGMAYSEHSTYHGLALSGIEERQRKLKGKPNRLALMRPCMRSEALIRSPSSANFLGLQIVDPVSPGIPFGRYNR